MPGASTIVIARGDFSISDGETGPKREMKRQVDVETQFFALIREKRPDVIVLDLRNATLDGTAAIQKIRQRSDVSIVVIRDERDHHEQDYRIAGAAECLLAPVDIIVLNAVVQNSRVPSSRLLSGGS